MNHGSVWWWGMCALVAFCLAGCYSREARVKERLDERVKAFSDENGRLPNNDEYAALKAQCEKEEDEERKAELAQAGRDAVAGASGVATGNYIVGAFLILGAAATVLGLNRKKKEAAPSGGAQ